MPGLEEDVQGLDSALCPPPPGSDPAVAATSANVIQEVVRVTRTGHSGGQRQRRGSRIGGEASCPVTSLLAGGDSEVSAGDHLRAGSGSACWALASEEKKHPTWIPGC